MYTIKRMLQDGYDATPCYSYRVENAQDGVYVHIFDNQQPGSTGRLTVQTMAYVENSEGKTVDRIHGYTSVVGNLDKPTQPPPIQRG
jgi:hypothetical protein